VSEKGKRESLQRKRGGNHSAAPYAVALAAVLLLLYALIFVPELGNLLFSLETGKLRLSDAILSGNLTMLAAGSENETSEHTEAGPNPQLSPSVPQKMILTRNYEPDSEISTEPADTEDDAEIPLSSVESDPDIKTITIYQASTAGYDYADGVYIKNDTDYSIAVDDYLSSKLSINPKAEDPIILIVHTHASEAYYPDGDDLYTASDTFRTEDPEYNMLRVGRLMTELFEARGYGVIHLEEVFDYPSYNGSYTRMLERIEEVLTEHPTIQMVIDVHRDSMVSASGEVYRAVTETDEGKAAQIMLVLGSDEGGLEHPNWQENLKLGIQLQKYVVDSYPRLMRPINLRSERFNQHVTAGSLLVEMGTSGNTLAEALRSTKLFTELFCDFLDCL